MGCVMVIDESQQIKLRDQSLELWNGMDGFNCIGRVSSLLVVVPEHRRGILSAIPLLLSEVASGMDTLTGMD